MVLSDEINNDNNYEEITRLTQDEVDVQPALKETDNSLLFTINQSNLKSFVKLMEILTSDSRNEDTVSIDNGKLKLNKDNMGIVDIDFSQILGNSTFIFNEPHKNIKKIKLLTKNCSEVKVYEFNRHYEFVGFKDGVHPSGKISILKSNYTNQSDETTIYEYGPKLELDVDVAPILADAKKLIDSDNYTIRINKDGGDINAIELGNQEFIEYFGDPDSDTTNLSVYNIFPIPKPENIVISIGRHDNRIILKSVSNFDIFTISYMIPCIEEYAGYAFKGDVI